MQVYLNDMLYTISYALDCVEAEFIGARTHHSARVAYICVRLGQAYGLPAEELLHLAAAAVLHDNALTEYVSMQEKPGDFNGKRLELRQSNPGALQPHCQMGERNVSILPFYQNIKDAVYYHHENADGSGAFGKKAEETPLFAQWIHFADQLDNRFPLDVVDADKHARIHRFVEKNAGHLFCPVLVQTFLKVFTEPIGNLLQGDKVRFLLREMLPSASFEYDGADMEALAAIFAQIIDYKSHFTCMHSRGIARKAHVLGAFLGESPEQCTRLYIAGALHDIGKLTIPNDILEKPGKLTVEEFEIMKTHAMASWNILSRMEGMEDVAEWASLHHEKLNGKGYPFGKTGESLNRYDRMLACVDIYQALIEPRPYKEGLSHERAMEIMRQMASQNFIDTSMTEAVNDCFGPDAVHAVS